MEVPFPREAAEAKGYTPGIEVEHIPDGRVGVMLRHNGGCISSPSITVKYRDDGSTQSSTINSFRIRPRGVSSSSSTSCATSSSIPSPASEIGAFSATTTEEEESAACRPTADLEGRPSIALASSGLQPLTPAATVDPPAPVRAPAQRALFPGRTESSIDAASSMQELQLLMKAFSISRRPETEAAIRAAIQEFLQ
jgi:hypothetical protein